MPRPSSLGAPNPSSAAAMPLLPLPFHRATCPEIPGANGQGEMIEETKANLRQAIELILEDRKADKL
jgi:hypothetical protein